MEERLRVGAQDEDEFDRSKRVGWLDLEAISESRVLMVGAGALGNEVAKDLVLSGVRHLTIVDMDRVVGSNLNRCLFFAKEDARDKALKAEALARGVKELRPEARPRPVVSRIEEVGEELFETHDVVLGCLDNIDARIHVNSHSYSAGRVYIDGGMEGFRGKVMVVRPPSGACLQCGMNKTHARVADMRFSCTGKDIVFHEPRLAAEITTTSIVSAVMVREVLKVLSGREDMHIANSFYYDGERNMSEELEIPLNPDCPVHVGRK